MTCCDGTASVTSLATAGRSLPLGVQEALATTQEPSHHYGS